MDEELKPAGWGYLKRATKAEKVTQDLLIRSCIIRTSIVRRSIIRTSVMRPNVHHEDIHLEKIHPKKIYHKKIQLALPGGKCEHRQCGCCSLVRVLSIEEATSKVFCLAADWFQDWSTLSPPTKILMAPHQKEALSSCCEYVV